MEHTTQCITNEHKERKGGNVRPQLEEPKQDKTVESSLEVVKPDSTVEEKIDFILEILKKNGLVVESVSVEDSKIGENDAKAKG